VPYIPPQFRDCAIYLYPTEQAAKAGQAVGGSGFLVGVRSLTIPGRIHLYAVTNEHVVRPARGNTNPIIRLNDRSGNAAILKVAVKSWLPHPDGDDITVTPVTLNSNHKVNWINRDEFITQNDLDQHQIGPGDECFMVGRLIDYDGKQRNEAVLRFGNLAMMPYPVLQLSRQRHQESFLVEMRSLRGFSGSPVVVYYVTVGTRDKPSREVNGGLAYASLVINKAWLLGVDWGVTSVPPGVNGEQDERKRTNSGISAVVPAWKLAELLDRDEFALAHREEEK
jgi:hypothetical protein